MLLETGRLKLLPLGLQDATLLHHMFTDPFIRKYLWDDDILSLEVVQEILTQNDQLFESVGWGLWKITTLSKSEAIGFTGLWTFFDEPQPQIIYGLLRSFTGQGYAREAAQAVITYSFGVLNFDYLIASMDKPHVASQKVAQQLKMSFFKEEMIDGKETVFYKLVSPVIN